MIFKIKLFLFFLFMLINNVSIQSQNTVNEKTKTDSLNYYYYKVLKPDSKGDLLNAFAFYRNQKDFQIKNNDLKGAIYSLRQIAIIQIELGILYDSEKSAIEALNIIEKSPKDKYTLEARIGVYNHLGRVYRKLFEYDVAIEYYKKSLILVQTESQKLVLKNNLGYAYLEQNQLDLAQIEFESVYEKSIVLKDSVSTSRSLNNLATIKSKRNDISAIEDFSQALKIRLLLGNISDIIGSYIDISDYYKSINDLHNASLNAHLAHGLAIKSGNANILESTLGLLINLKNDHEIIEYKKLTDSIKKANALFEGKYATKKYALEKQEKLANDRLLQVEKEKNLKLIYGFLSIFILVLSVIVFRYLKIRFKKQNEIEVYNTELRISKKVHDELANDLYHIMTKLQHKEYSEGILDDLEVVYNKTRDISRAYNDVNVQENFNELLLDLISHFKNGDISVIVKDISKIDWSKVKDNKKIAIYRIIQELLTNMKKHSRATFVVLNFFQDANKTVINYRDNGIGCNLKTQNGLQNTENRMHAINGSITFESKINNGFKAKIII